MVIGHHFEGPIPFWEAHHLKAEHFPSPWVHPAQWLISQGWVFLGCKEGFNSYALWEEGINLSWEATNACISKS